MNTLIPRRSSPIQLPLNNLPLHNMEAPHIPRRCSVPLLFCIGLNPLSQIIAKSDIGMSFGLDKCGPDVQLNGKNKVRAINTLALRFTLPDTKQNVSAPLSGQPPPDSLYAGDQVCARFCCVIVEMCDCRPSAAPALTLSSPLPVQQLDFNDSSPVFLRRSSLTSSLNDDDEDDGFHGCARRQRGDEAFHLHIHATITHLDMFNNFQNDSEMLTGMSSLLIAPLVTDSTGEDLPAIHCRRRSMFASQSMPSPVSRTSVKRPDCPRDGNTPVRVKRGRHVSETHDTILEQNPESPRMPFLLPTVEGRHQDLKYITSDTWSKLLSLTVIDPYEFGGGHIKGALNLHQEDRVEEFLLKTPIVPSRPEKRVILIFHCEFSSERGPRMCLFGRERDRAENDYPKLH
ncbi:hypothetical protein Q5P01_000493 [Channa striata]|uniref:protein-tyrosine-phosphatase n=1 Tax=Channa striata TaxID=64152 RepID=A0AA88IH87_CHASR|nr:hypothetical protein Q5P01_000493 [Channa striata]